MRAITLSLALLLTTGLVQPSFAFDEAAAKQLIAEKISTWATSPEVIDAVKKQNETTSSYDQAKIDELDAKWKADDTALIDGVLKAPGSETLKKVVADSDGLYTEIFVMDAKGLNVIQSDKTSDYWQGDEDKFTKTFVVGPDAISLGEVEMDESTQAYSQQLSFTLTDGTTPIGAVTVGLNADKLK
ncbi:MAG: hypothetical protein WC043_08580 [Pseudobdellovibrionaceae bacterium]